MRRNEKLEFSQRYGVLLVKETKKVTKLYQPPMCFDANTSNSYESILQEENILKSQRKVRLVACKYLH